MIDTRQRGTLVIGVAAGAAGGVAEIAWVSLYAGMAGGDPAVLAGAVTTAAGVGALLPSASPAILGVGLHMVLAVMLGIVLTAAWQVLSAKRGPTNPYPFMLAALAGVWAMNFFLVLPIVSPAFVHMVPYAISLISKLLFGVAAAEVVRRLERFIAPAPAIAFRLVRSGKAKRT